MNPMELYDHWAPADSPWSAWAKPVLFAWKQPVLPGYLAEANTHAAFLDLPVAPRQAWVIDLPGAAAVLAGAALARNALRPVPLFNGVPDAQAVIDVGKLLTALEAQVPALADLQATALPAFMLDARRMLPERALLPGAFDNRWQVVPQDFPSANRLLVAGIDEVVVLTTRVQDDLAHVLRRWQEAGVRLLYCDPAHIALAPLDVPRPPWFRSLWWRWLVATGLRANSAGGFGAAIPHPSSSSG